MVIAILETDREFIIFSEIMHDVFHFCRIKIFLFCAKNLKIEPANFCSIAVASAYYETCLFKEKYSRRKIRRTSWHFRCIYEDLLWQNGLAIQREGAQSLQLLKMDLTSLLINTEEEQLRTNVVPMIFLLC